MPSMAVLLIDNRFVLFILFYALHKPFGYWEQDVYVSMLYSLEFFIGVYGDCGGAWVDEK